MAPPERYAIFIVLTLLIVNVVDAAAFIEERGESRTQYLQKQFQGLYIVVVVVVGLYVDKNQHTRTKVAYLN